MNPKYANAPLLYERRKQWTRENIQNNIDEVFKSIEMLNGWKYLGSEWIEIPVSSRRKKEELKKSIFSLIRCKVLSASEKEFDYTLQIPDLYYNQFFYIGGFLKVPIFQLFDDPIIYRALPNGVSTLKLRTNSIAIGVDVHRKDNIPLVNIFGKDLPFHQLLACAHTKDELNEFISRHPVSNEVLDVIYKMCNEYWDKNLTLDESNGELGKHFANHPNEIFKKGESALFSLKVAYETDHFSRKFFKEKSLLFELMNAIYDGTRSDTDIKYKRVRFLEYVLSPLVHKIYDMLITLNKHGKDKYQIPQNLILEHCNVSDGSTKNAVANIVHYNNPINPIGELASFLQCSLVGPGGFKKDNVPPHLRNMDDSHYAILCAADTPDREGCGVVTNLSPVVGIDDNGRFINKHDDCIVSYPISLVPFLQNDDPTRLQMASNQNKQTIMLRDAEKPTIRSGNECLYLDETTFLKVAEEDGTVIHVDNNYMIVVYDKSKKVDVIPIRHRTLYLNTIDFITPKFNTGETFKAKDILAQSKFIQDGELAIGRNFLTVVSIYKGFNYEDGIIISESVSKKMKSLHAVDLSFEIDKEQVLLSLSNDDYLPIPQIGQILKKGEVFARLKNVDWQSGIENINEDAEEQRSPLDCKVVSVEIYPNVWNRQIEDYDVMIKKIIGNQLTRYNMMVNSLTPFIEKDKVDKFMMLNNMSSLNCDSRHIGNFYNKGKKIRGTLLKIRGLYNEEIGIGDKMANRHGNKGVVARIIPDDQMPLLEDGRRAEVIINPLGIISRMNVGQLFELAVGEAIYQLKRMMKENLVDAELLLTNFLTILMGKDHWTTKKVLASFNSDCSATDIITAIDNIYIIMPPFETPTPEKVDKVMQFTGAKYKMNITDGETGEKILNPVAAGYMYFDKLVHRASDKISARSIGPYSRKTSQPMGGKTNQGGHRLGEMEVWALLAHDSKDFLGDLLTVHSDSIGLKNKALADILQNPSLAEGDENDDKPQSLRVLESYLNIMALTIEGVESSDIMRQDEYYTKTSKGVAKYDNE